MIEISVHADVRDYREKPLFGLSGRKAVCVAAAAATAVGLGAALVHVWGMRPEDAAWPVIGVCVPVWLLGFWRPLGLPAEDYLAAWARHRFGKSRVPNEAARPADRRARRMRRRHGAARKPARGEELLGRPASRGELRRARRAQSVHRG
ncbi:hypothetical protein B5F40_04615 [Gordonibacter sp. An230]|uniref:PrgI family protein n=1 Tax=Gordonibacter sp. An230 TaxID=1965592 RepID=UPI000B36547B|nr:hypothetical protein B5F40_04615 [Gordonibacter sp. An230]